MQPVWRYERLERNVIDFAPMLHHVEAREQVDVFPLCGRGDQFDHARHACLHDYLRRELRIDQHDVGTDGADLFEAIADRGVVVADLVIVDDRIGAELPQNEVRLSGYYGGIEALKHVADFFASDAAIDHGDRMVGEMLLKLARQPVRITRRCRACARAGRR